MCGLLQSQVDLDSPGKLQQRAQEVRLKWSYVSRCCEANQANILNHTPEAYGWLNVSRLSLRLLTER